MATSDWEDSVSAILECWLTGQAGGGAVADLLLGAVNPSGHLSETIPVRLGDNPASLNFPGEAGHVRYGEGVFVGYRGFDAANRAVSFPFGHGLSYTTFDFANLAISRAGSVTGGDLRITVSFDVSNTGSVTGKTVAQVYVRDPEASVARPPRELRAFRKVELGPGRTERVRVQLTARDLSYWSPLTSDWALEGGQFVLEVGASSRDIRVSEVFDVEAPSVAAPLTADSSLQEWYADPVGGPALRKRLPADASVHNPELLSVVGNFPIGRMASMHGLGVTQEAVDAALAEVRAADPSSVQGSPRAHLLGQRHCVRCADLVEAGDDTGAVGVGAVLTQLGLGLDPADHQFESDDGAQLAVDVPSGSVGDVPRLGLGGLVLVGQPGHQAAQPFDVVVGDEAAVDVQGGVVPGRHYPAVLALGVVPARRHVVVRPAQNHQRLDVPTGGTPMVVVARHVAQQDVPFRFVEQRQEGRDQTVVGHGDEVGRTYPGEPGARLVRWHLEMRGHVHAIDCAWTAAQ